jgi:tetratricopeptide (TPR) repeat protein
VSRAIESSPQNDTENIAVFLGNRAACYSAMEEYSLAIDDCTLSLEKKVDYVKVLMRRSQAYEKLDKIDEALADAKKVYELEPQSYPKLPITM